jgi:hypothetical protein
LIGKTAFRRNLAQRIVGHRHQFLSACDSHSPDILARSTAKAHLECAIELASAELHHLGEISPIDLRAEVDGYVTLNAARLPKLHAIVILHRRRPHRISVDGSGFIGCVADHAITLRSCDIVYLLCTPIAYTRKVDSACCDIPIASGSVSVDLARGTLTVTQVPMPGTEATSIS